MAPGRPIPPLQASDDEIKQMKQLNSLADLQSNLQPLVQRARFILLRAAGDANAAVAQRIGLMPIAVGRWPRRYLALGSNGLHDEPRPGGQRSHDDATVDDLIEQRQQSEPRGGGRPWRGRSLPLRPACSESRCTAGSREA